MGRKRHKPEEIVAKLRQVDVLIAQGNAGLGWRSGSIGRHRGHVLPLAFRSTGGLKVRPGEAAEGSGDRERAAAQGGLPT